MPIGFARDMYGQSLLARSGNPEDRQFEGTNSNVASSSCIACPRHSAPKLAYRHGRYIWPIAPALVPWSLPGTRYLSDI